MGKDLLTITVGPTIKYMMDTVLLDGSLRFSRTLKQVVLGSENGFNGFVVSKKLRIIHLNH